MNATVAERGGRARAIRNQGPRQSQRRRSQPNPRTAHRQLPGQPATAVPSPNGMSRSSAAPGQAWETPAGTALRAAPAPGTHAPGGAPHQRSPHLRLVADHGRLLDPVFESSARRPGEKPSTPPEDQAAARRARPVATRPDRPRGQGRLRLTRRGRLALTSTVVLVVAVVSMVLASTAQAVVHL